MTPLTIHGWGAVTPVGLNSAQSCAAIRTKLSNFQETSIAPPPAEPQVVARVPAKRFLRRTPAEWLVSLAGRAIAECMEAEQPDPRHTVLMIAAPEDFRRHPATEVETARSILQDIQMRLGVRFHPESGFLAGGPAAVYRGLEVASTVLQDEGVHYCIVGGVDSLLNVADLSRLSASHRLRGPTNAQGLVPAEGASFLLVSADARWRRFRPLGQVLGIGTGNESNTVLGADYSVGDGMLNALATAATQAEGGEPALGFVASTFNGERYGAWESMIARPRFYRTRRERLEILYPAMSVGEMGTAAAALAVIVACTAIDRGYAPGPIAMCEAASDEGLRAACVVGPSPSPPAFSGPGRRNM